MNVLFFHNKSKFWDTNAIYNKSNTPSFYAASDPIQTSVSRFLLLHGQYMIVDIYRISFTSPFQYTFEDFDQKLGIMKDLLSYQEINQGGGGGQ